MIHIFDDFISDFYQLGCRRFLSSREFPPPHPACALAKNKAQMQLRKQGEKRTQKYSQNVQRRIQFQLD
jgi:hypothetical protein